MMTSLGLDGVMEGPEVLQAQGRDQDRTVRMVPEYAVLDVSVKAVQVILSYAECVNRSVWRKYQR